jgi:hypothetical protein
MLNCTCAARACKVAVTTSSSTLYTPATQVHFGNDFVCAQTAQTDAQSTGGVLWLRLMLGREVVAAAF